MLVFILGLIIGMPLGVLILGLLILCKVVPPAKPWEQ